MMQDVKLVWSLKEGVVLPLYAKKDSIENQNVTVSKEPEIQIDQDNLLKTEQNTQEVLDTKENLDSVETSKFQENSTVLQDKELYTDDFSVNKNTLKKIRPTQTDIYLDTRVKISYANDMLSFLISKGISISNYDEQYSYLDSDIILLSVDDEIENAKTFLMKEDISEKHKLWDFLKAQFKDRLTNG